MPNYIIIAPSDSILSDVDILNRFERFFAIIPDSAWAISTPLPTCADVRDSVRQEPSVGKTCVVVKVTEYNGHAKRDLWEKLEAWEHS